MFGKPLLLIVKDEKWPVWPSAGDKLNKWWTVRQWNVKQLLKRMRMCSTYWYRNVSAVLLMSAGQFIVSFVYSKRRGYPRRAYTCREHFRKETQETSAIKFASRTRIRRRGGGGWKLTLAPKPFYTTWIFFFFFNQVHALLFWLKENNISECFHPGREKEPAIFRGHPTLGLHGCSIHFKETKSSRWGKQNDSHRLKIQLKKSVPLHLEPGFGLH